MKKLILALLFFIAIVKQAEAQTYCGLMFEATSVERSIHCKYCDESYQFVVPGQIHFKKTFICSTLRNPLEADEDSKCRFNSLNLYLSYLYFYGWANSNTFPNKKCSGIYNPGNTHVGYQGKDRNVGVKTYVFEDTDLEKMVDLVNRLKGVTGDPSINQGLRVSALYALECLRLSCQ